MKATRVIAWLLFIYWVFVGLANLFFVQGLGVEGSIEFIIYTSIGIGCYLLTMKIGRLLSKHRNSRTNREISKWW